MSIKKIIVFSSLVLLALITAGIVFLIWFNEPKQVLERNFEITLPQKIHILNYTKQHDVCAAKLLVTDSDIDFIEKHLTYNMHIDLTPEQMPNGRNVVDWWDMDNNDVDFFTFEHKDISSLFYIACQENWIYITKSINGKKYLYLCGTT